MKIAASILTLAAAASALPAAAGDNYHVYFGCYTNAKSGSKGILVSKFNAQTGALSEPVLAAETASPSFLAIHPDKKHLLAVGEDGAPGAKGGAVTAFSISQPDGLLRQINQVSSGGPGPCHISIDPAGQMAMVANYGGGSVASYQIQTGGGLSESQSFHQHTGGSVNPKRQKEPHAHSINSAPGGKYAVACDLGTDKISIYAMDPATGKLAPHGSTPAAPGSGPRHLAFHPGGKFAFVNNELTMTAATYAWDAAAGSLTEVASVSTLPEADRGKTGYSTAETVAHPNGKNVYVSNRSHDTIAVFSCDAATGKLTLIQNAPAEGRIPRNFCLDPSGRWMIVAHQDSNTAAVLKVDAETGKLSPAGVTVKAGGAVCVRFLAAE